MRNAILGFVSHNGEQPFHLLSAGFAFAERFMAGILAEISPRRETRKRRRAILIGQCVITPEIYVRAVGGSPVSRRRRFIALMDQRNGIGIKMLRDADVRGESLRVARSRFSFVAFPDSERFIWRLGKIEKSRYVHVEEFQLQSSAW